jgi:hypothetical protein
MVSMSSQVINSEPVEVVIGTDGQTIDAALSQTLPMIPDDDIGGGLLIADRWLHSIENCYIQSKGADRGMSFTPEMQLLSDTGWGTPVLSQQWPFGSCPPGLTHVHDTHWRWV